MVIHLLKEKKERRHEEDKREKEGMKGRGRWEKKALDSFIHKHVVPDKEHLNIQCGHTLLN